MTRPRKETPRPVVRCAVYTRKSTEEGLEQEFNTLDAQRESGEAYIKSQAHEGWVCDSERFDDGGFTGGNMERPALKRLLQRIADGEIDCVVVYKVDRLSRSLIDFARMMETFDEHGVAFVAVTQTFNTASSMGRLILNVLLSFAQFEREIISERTRDKIAAARRKGKWVGGRPVLGYDVDQTTHKLIVNEEESQRVRDIFDLYLERQALIPVVTELNDRDWKTKQWVTRKGKPIGGKPFDKCSVYKLLTNVVYLGKVTYKSEIHEGEHEAIVESTVWDRVQKTLKRNGRDGGTAVRNKHNALLKGILYCGPCDCTMGHTYSMKKGSTRYRYYVCLSAQKRGWNSCPSKSVPAEEIEQLVVDQIRAIGRNPGVIRATISHARERAEDAVRGMEAEEKGLKQDARRHNAEIQRLVLDSTLTNGSTTAQIAHLNESIGRIESRLREIRSELPDLRGRIISEREVTEALTAFDPVWETLSPRERERVVRLLVDRIEYDGAKGTVALTFHADGLQLLSHEIEEAAA